MMKRDKINHVRHSHLGEEGRRGCINIKSFSFSHLLPMSIAKHKQMKKRTWHSELATGEAKLTPRSRTYSAFVPGSLLVLLLEPCGSKITADGDCSHKIKTLAPWKKSYDQPSRDITLPTKGCLIKSSFFLFLDFFFMWTIFKVFIEFVTLLFLFYVLSLWPYGIWDLSSPTSDGTNIPCISSMES